MEEEETYEETDYSPEEDELSKAVERMARLGQETDLASVLN